MLLKTNSLKYFFWLSLLLYSSMSYGTCTTVIGLIPCSCSVGTTAVAFGNYNPISATATTANGNVAVTCGTGLAVLINASYVISMNTGLHSASFTTRNMQLSAVNLGYNLYTTNTFATVWGDGNSGTGTVSDSYGSLLAPLTRNYTVFGRVPALQAVGVGTYTDTVTVTVTY